MPEISRFFGIVIQMYYGDHEPPHFHVRYAGQKALVEIESLELLRGAIIAEGSRDGSGMGSFAQDRTYGRLDFREG